MARPLSTSDIECDTTWNDDHGRHRCIKPVEHIGDITNDDHRCCCGATHDDE